MSDTEPNERHIPTTDNKIQAKITKKNWNIKRPQQEQHKAKATDQNCTSKKNWQNWVQCRRAAQKKK